MGLKDKFLTEELKRSLRNVKKDVVTALDETWSTEYKGHLIRVTFKVKQEELFIDDIVVDRIIRKSLLSHVKPYTKLSGTLELEDGTKHKVSVKLGGFIRMNCIIKIDNETIYTDSKMLDFYLWDSRERIVPYIEKQVEVHNKVVNEALPDDEYFYDENQQRLDAGLADRIVDEELLLPVKKIVKLFEAQVNKPTIKTRKATYEKVAFETIANYSGEFIDRFQYLQLDEDLVQQEALWLLDHAAHREVVKFALIVLGCTNCENYKELLFKIGLHEEFTMYSLFALRNGTMGANNLIFELAQILQGWGKIAAVQHLHAPTPDIKHWLLTKGCENNIQNEFLAYECAVKGELDRALDNKVISKELYDGAGLLIEGLLSEVVPEGMDDYTYAGFVLTKFANHAHTHCHSLDDFYTITKISDYLNQDSKAWEKRFNKGWKYFERTSILEAIQPIIDNPIWKRLSLDKLQFEYNYVAAEIAHFYKIDSSSLLFDLLKNDSTNSSIYNSLMKTKNSQTVKELCAFAEDTFALGKLSNDEQYCLRYIVQGLREYESVGLPLIEAALSSEDEVLQFHALYVLDGWSPFIWRQTGITEKVSYIAASAKDKEIRQLARQVIKEKIEL